MRSGTVCWVNLEPSHPLLNKGPEFGKTRPCLIISNTEQNEILSSVVVIPLSSKAPEIWPLRIKLENQSKPSFAVIPGIRQVSKTRILNNIFEISEADLKKIKDALLTYLS